jgi:Papain-like cysteine protease AvrRpt2
MQKVIYIIAMFCTINISCQKSTCLSLNASEMKYNFVPVQFVPQNGPTSCWAASLNMVMKNGVFENTKTTPKRYFKDLMEVKNTAYTACLHDSLSLSSYSDISWSKIKLNLDGMKPLLFYKYFEVNELENFAHVAILNGYAEIGKRKLLFTSDPWPVGRGIQAIVEFGYFAKPVFVDLPYDFPRLKIINASGKISNESVFSISSDFSLIDSQTNTYSISGEKVESANNIKNIESININYLNQNKVEEAIKREADSWLCESKSYPKLLLEKIGLDTTISMDSLSFDYKGLLSVSRPGRRINQFNESAKTSILLPLNTEPTVISSYQDSYLFDDSKVYYLTLLQKDKKKAVFSFETDSRAYQTSGGNIKQVYISRFEPYSNSMANDFEKGLELSRNFASQTFTNKSSPGGNSLKNLRIPESSLKIDSLAYSENSTGYKIYLRLKANLGTIEKKFDFIYDPFNITSSSTSAKTAEFNKPSLKLINPENGKVLENISIFKE